MTLDTNNQKSQSQSRLLIPTTKSLSLSLKVKKWSRTPLVRVTVLILSKIVCPISPGGVAGAELSGNEVEGIRSWNKEITGRLLIEEDGEAFNDDVAVTIGAFVVVVVLDVVGLRVVVDVVKSLKTEMTGLLLIEDSDEVVKTVVEGVVVKGKVVVISNLVPGVT